MKQPLKSQSPLNSKRLFWSQISDFFEGEWVELVDYKWDWNQPFPTWARVRNHANDRRELMSKINSDGEIKGSIVLFLGAARSTFEHSLSAAI